MLLSPENGRGDISSTTTSRSAGTAPPTTPITTTATTTTTTTTTTKDDNNNHPRGGRTTGERENTEKSKRRQKREQSCNIVLESQPPAKTIHYSTDAARAPKHTKHPPHPAPSKQYVGMPTSFSWLLITAMRPYCWSSYKNLILAMRWSSSMRTRVSSRPRRNFSRRSSAGHAGRRWGGTGACMYVWLDGWTKR